MTIDDRPGRPTDEDLRQRRWPPGGGKPIDKATVAGEAFALRYIGDALMHLADIISSTSGPGLRDGIRERPSTWPPDSGDTVESRNLPAAPPEVGDDPAGSDGSTATRGPAVGTGESTGPTSFDFIVGAHHDVRPDRSRNIGVEDHSAFPVGEWTRLYVPTARLDECTAALDALGSGAHAPDRPVVIAGEDESPVSVEDIDDVIWVRSTGRGQHDVMMAANPVPIVLASILFTEGVKGRTLALERFAAALGSVSQDVQP